MILSQGSPFRWLCTTKNSKTKPEDPENVASKDLAKEKSHDCKPNLDLIDNEVVAY